MAATTDEDVGEAKTLTTREGEVRGEDGAVEEVPAWLVELDERLQGDATDFEGQRMRVVGFLELGMYDRAFRGLHQGLYVMAQHDALPPVSAWLDLLEPHFDMERHAAEGVRYLSIVDDFYPRSTEVAGLLVDYLLAQGRTDVAMQMLRAYVHDFPGDPTWPARLEALEGSADARDVEGAARGPRAGDG